MEKKIISFKGISNVPDDGLNEAGDMSVLLNMRHKGGELVPCQPPTPVRVDDNISQVLYHANSGYWLALKRGELLVYDNKFNVAESIADRGTIVQSGVESFALMGNIVIMNFADRVEYAIWRNGGYVYLGELPTSFTLDFELTKKQKNFVSENTFSTKDRTAANYYKLVKNGFVDKALDFAYKDKGFVDRTIVEYGLRLFDGSYIPVGYADLDLELDIPDRYSVKTKPVTVNGNVADEAQIETEITYFTVKFPSAAPISAVWKDVILGVDCFCCGSITNFTEAECSYTNASFDTVSEYIYRQKTNEELERDIVEAPFFRVATIGFASTDIWMTNTSPSSLAQLDSKKDIVLTQDISESKYVYNNRLHAVSKYRLYDGFITSQPGTKANTVSYAVFNEDKITKKSYVGALGKMLMYPSEEVFSIGVEHGTNSGVFVFNYKKGGKSFYFDTNDEYLCISSKDGWNVQANIPGLYPDTYIIKASMRNDTYGFMVSITRKYNGELFMGAYWTKEISPYLKNYLSLGAEIEVSIGYETSERLAPIELAGNGLSKDFKAKNNVITEPNVLKVSAVDNPFYFPTAQTYKFEGEIVGLASNAEAISTGQFGQYPLFVFTDTGIWAMSVDASGQGAYTTQSPFSREVCNGAICPVSGGVVFSTDKGVMVISGGQVADLSAALDGFEVDFFKYNAEMWNAIFAKAGKEVVNPVPIREYIKGAVLAYNYHYNEIILSNKAKGYSYVYSLTNRVWSVVDMVFDLTTNKYPELVVFDKQGKMFTFADGGSGIVPVVAITRPFTLGSFDFKRLRQAGLRTTFEGSLNFYLLGSNDGAVFKCITGKEVNTDNLDEGTYRDLITAMSRSKQYKYFAIAIAGQMSGRVSMAELLVDAGFANNKIR